MKQFVLIFQVLLFYGVNAQFTPSSYLSDWSNAGLLPDSFKPQKVLRIHPLPDTTTPVNELFLQAFAQLNGKPGIVLLEEGRYLLNGTLNIPSNVMIKGRGPGKTIMYIQNNGSRHGLAVQGQIKQKRTEIRPPDRGHRLIELKEPLLESAQWIRWIRDDEHLCHNNWCQSTTGQLFKIEKTKGTTLFLHDVVRDSSAPGTNHYITIIQPAENVFLESFTIIRLDKTTDQASNIFFNYAINCKVSEVESFYTNYAHVEARNSAHITIAGNYFSLSHGYGSGGRAYGVMLHLGTVNTLVMDNIFEHLRHSMILQAGANGNVFAFNLSTHPRQTTGVFGIEIENTLTGDMVLHGNYPYANLFEGNRAWMAIADNSHGASGPNNVFFKNHITRHGFSVVENNTNRIALINNYIEGPIILFFGREHMEINTVTNSAIRRPQEVNIQTLTLALKCMDKSFQKAYKDAHTLQSIVLPAEIRYQSTVKTSSRYSRPAPKQSIRMQH